MKHTLILHATLEIDAPSKDVAKALAGLASNRIPIEEEKGPLGPYTVSVTGATVSEIRGKKVEKDG